MNVELAFWIFLLIVAMLIPATMLFYGWIFIKKPPQNINSVYGYRSARSMKSREAWAFAHAYCGKIWFRMGWGVLALSIVWMALTLGRNVDGAGQSVCVLVALQMFAFLAAVPLTERALKREFDGQGRRRRQENAE